MMKLLFLAELLLVVLAAARKFEPIQVEWAKDNKFIPTRRKHNWCEDAKKVHRVRKFGTLLRDREVSIVFFDCRRPSCANESTVPGVLWDADAAELTGGFLVKVWAEVAARADFKWHETVAVSDFPDRELNENFDEVYQWAAENYDVVADWVSMTPARAAEQLRFAYPFMDLSLVLVGVVNTANPGWITVMSSFLRPFAVDVWLATLLSFLVGAVAYRHFEKGQDDIPPESVKDGTSFLTSLYLTTANFTGGGGAYQPKTMPGRLFSVGFNFSLLLIVAAYTANLASLLVVNDQRTWPVSSLEDAVQSGVTICASAGGSTERILREDWPKLGVKWTKGHRLALAQTVQGDCAAAVVPRFFWEVAKGRRQRNPGCVLETIGEPVKSLHASFAFRSDDAVNCTAVVADYVTVILQEMVFDGWIGTATEQLLREVHDQSCPTQQTAAEEGVSLKLKDMIGIFAIPIVALAASLACHRAPLGPCRPRRGSQDDGDEDH